MYRDLKTLLFYANSWQMFLFSHRLWASCSHKSNFVFKRHSRGNGAKTSIHWLMDSDVEWTRPVWSNHRPAGRRWPATAFSVVRGSIQEKIFKSEISWKACEVTLVPLTCLRRIKSICRSTTNNTFSVHHFDLIIDFTIKLEGTARR